MDVKGSDASDTSFVWGYCSVLHAIPLHLLRFGEEQVGFRYVASGPLVRSSYKAGEFFTEAMIQADRARSA